MMTSKERMLTVLRHEIPDRVPVSFYELDECIKPDNWYAQQPSYRELCRLCLDNCDLMPFYYFPLINRAIDIKEHSWREGDRVHREQCFEWKGLKFESKWKKDDSIFTVWKTEHPIKTPEHLKIFADLPMDITPLDFTKFRELQNALGERGIVLVSINEPCAYLGHLIEFDKFVLWAYEEPEITSYAIQRMGEHILQFVKMILAGNIGTVLFRIVGGEHMAPPYLSPELFHKYFCEPTRKIVDLIHNAGCFARVHHHGKMGVVAETIKATFPDAVDPVEPPPAGDVSITEAKKLLGKQIAIMGNLELTDIELKNNEEFENLVQKTVLEGKEGGNFVLLASASPIDAPLKQNIVENYKSMIKAVNVYGKY